MSLLALLPEAEASKVSLLQDVCNAQGVPLAGAIFPELIDSTAFRKQGVMLVCMANPPGAFLLQDIQHDGALRMQAAVAGLMQELSADDGDGGTLFLVFDAMLPNIGTLLDDTHAGLQRAPRYIGVNAGSESFQAMPCLFDNDRLVQNGVLGLYFPQGHEIGRQPRLCQIQQPMARHVDHGKPHRDHRWTTRVCGLPTNHLGGVRGPVVKREFL